MEHKRPAGNMQKPAIVVSVNFKPKGFDEAEKLSQLEASVRAIQLNESTTVPREHLYQNVKLLCDSKKNEVVFNRLQTLFQEHVTTILAPSKFKTPDSTTILQSLNDAWIDFCEKLDVIRQIYIYLERSYLKPKDMRSIYDIGIRIFREKFIAVEQLTQRVVQGILSLFLRERSGDQLDKHLMQNLVRIVIDLQLYESELHAPLMEQTDSFYRAESASLLQSLETPEYLIHCEKRMKEESDLAGSMLEPNSRKQIVEIICQNFIIVPHTAILEKGFSQLANQGRIDDLSRLYRLFYRTQLLPTLKAAFVSYIKKTGAEMLKDQDRETTLVQDLLDMKDSVDNLVRTSFRSNESFANGVKEGFGGFINVVQNKPAELIAKYIDAKLRAGNKESTEDEMEIVMDKVLVLFRFIEGKDVFEAFYKKLLSKRLLLGKSASNDLEKSVISKLKTECGSGFTMKIEGMFKDIELSKDIMENFRQSRIASSLPADIDAYFHVLSSGHWLADKPLPISIPNEFLKYQEAFVTYYKSCHTGRLLQWQHNLGHCVVRANFPQGRKELTLSFLQTIVLILFNEKPTVSFKEILERTNIETKELKRNLQSLACGKVRVIQKSPKGRDVEDDDEFTFNDEFSNKLMKIKINTIQFKETAEENQAINEKVFRDRQYLIDAAIVRIMKTRKTLSHNMLMSELLSLLKFQLKPQDAKKRIESLIERDYLERDDSDSNTYRYLA